MQVDTPAYVYDETQLSSVLHTIRSFSTRAQSVVLFSLKSLSIRDILLHIGSYVDGFSASSAFEVELARDVGGDRSVVSYISPILRDHEVEKLGLLCDRITVNSLSQLARFSTS